MKAHRLARVGEVVREVAATTILMELRDPRVKKVTVTRAEVSADLQHATIYVSVMGSEREQNLTLHGLQSAAGFIQSRLANRHADPVHAGRAVQARPRREELARDRPPPAGGSRATTWWARRPTRRGRSRRIGRRIAHLSEPHSYPGGFAMPATMTKQKLLTHFLGALKKRYDAPAEPERNVLEQLLYALLRENASRKDADRAYRNLRERFFDWNEVRVSSIHEVGNALVDLPQPVAKAQRVIGLLQEVFEANYSFDSNGLPKKGVQPGSAANRPLPGDQRIHGVVGQAQIAGWSCRAAG